MKTTTSLYLLPLTAALLTSLFGASIPSQAQTLYSANAGNGTVSAFNTTTNTAQPTFIAPSGFSSPDGLALAGNTLYVSDYSGNKVSAYDATTGLATNFSFSVNKPVGLAVSGQTLFVAYVLPNGNGAVSGYSTTDHTLLGTPTQGITIANPQGLALTSSNLYYVDAGTNTVGALTLSGSQTPANYHSPTGLSTPISVAVYNNELFVSNQGTKTITEYNATTGASMILNDAPLITNTSAAGGLAISGNILYFVNNAGTVGEYNLATNTLIGNAVITTGLSSPNGLVVTPVPEPATWLAGTLLLGAVGARWRARRFPCNVRSGKGF